MKIYRPGLPALYIDEPAPPVTSSAMPAGAAHMPPEIAKALADARRAAVLNKPPPGAETQPTPSQSSAAPVLLPESGLTPPPPPPPEPAPAAKPVEPKPAVRTAPRPGKIPENLQTGGHEARTVAGAKP